MHSRGTARAATTWHARTISRRAPSLSSRLPGDDTSSRLNGFGLRLFTPVMSRYGADNVKQPVFYRSDEPTFFSHRFLAIVTLEDRRWTIVATAWQRSSLSLSFFFSLVEGRRLDSCPPPRLFSHAPSCVLPRGRSYYLKTRVGRSSSGWRHARNKEGFLAKPKRIMRRDESPIDRRDFTGGVCRLRNRVPLLHLSLSVVVWILLSCQN